MLIDINNKKEIDVDKETQQRANRSVDIAKKSIAEIQRQCKIAKAQGEKQPHLLEQMSLAYANALSHYATYKFMEDTGFTWERAKENAFDLLRITLDHIEQEFNPPTEQVK